MREHPIADRIPWYVTGKLDRDEARETEAHLRECAACSALAEQARAQLAFAAGGLPDELLDHVEPGLLNLYADRPESLEPETRAWVERILESCSTCREALDRLREVEVALSEAPRGTREVEPADVPPRWLGRVWDALAATILRPVPALAYLLLLAMLIPGGLWLVERGKSPAILGPTTVLHTGSERQLREPDAGRTESPLVIPRDPVVWINLETGLGSADVTALQFTAELWQGERRLFARSVGEGEFEMRDGRAVLPLVLQAATLRTGKVYEIRLRVDESDGPLDGQVLFRRRLRVDGEEVRGP